MSEYVIIAIIVALALYIAWRKLIRKPSCGCGCGAGDEETGESPPSCRACDAGRPTENQGAGSGDRPEQ